MRATSDGLEFDTAHRPGALTRYFAKRWLIWPDAKGEQVIAWLLEAALGRNTMYFIEKTKEYIDEWGGCGEVVPANAFDGFAITGDPVEDTLIPHAVLVWTCMNDRPWPEEVYHRWLDQLLAAGSPEAAYLAASLWPAHDLMTKVTYRPVRWRVYQGQLDADAERLILTEMLKGKFGPRVSLYGSFEYDDVPNPEQLPEEYIKRHGFTHPICGLVELSAFTRYGDLRNRIQEALAAPSWSEGVKGAAMLLYLSLKAFNELIKKQEPDEFDSLIRFKSDLRIFSDCGIYLQELLYTLDQNLFKLDERHINIINFHIDKIEKIDYNLIKDYINYLIILYNKKMGGTNLSINMFSKYMSIGLRTKDIFYIGKDIKNTIFILTLKDKDKLKLWLEEQADDLRIKDLLLATYMNQTVDYTYLYTITMREELKICDVWREIDFIYGKIKYIDEIRLFIDQARKYFNQGSDSYIICDFIEDILKIKTRINFDFYFKEDYSKIIHTWHPSRNFVLEEDTFLESNHIGLYLYYNILNGWGRAMLNFIHYINKEKEVNLYSKIRNKIIENLYTNTMSNVEKINLYLNKIEGSDLPCEETKYELITDLIQIIENNYYEALEYFKDERKLIKVREVILYNIRLIWDKFRNSRLIELLGINNKSQNTMIY